MRGKITFTFLAFGALFLIVLVKAFYIQVISKDKLLSYAENQFLRKVKVYPKRANILDRNAEPLAINVQTYNIYTIPEKKWASSYRQLSGVLKDLSFEQIQKKTRGRRKKYTWLARQIRLTDQQVKKIKSIDGVYVESMPSRMYPNQEILSHVLGFVGVDNNGLSGIEYSMDQRLRGEPQIIKYYKDAKGRPTRYETKRINLEVEDLHLSIDKEIQAAAETYLREGIVENEAQGGGIAVMDATTGELWALANYPTFDPNNYRKYGPKNRKLSFISDPFEPGSSFKAFTITSALLNNVVNVDTNYYCELGRMKVDDHVITEAGFGKSFEWLSVEDILKYSSNIGTTKIAFDLTYPKLKETLELLGLNQKTGIELPGESRGISIASENVKPLTLSNISFGQGIAITPIQLMRAYSIYANDGKMVNPTILKKNDENLKDEGTQVIPKKLALTLQKMLLKVVSEGTGSNAGIPLYEVAGKTSTAQRVTGEGGYQGYISSFIGFPINVSRRFLVFVYVDNPQKEYYGNKVAAPIFRKITQYILFRKREFKNLTIDDTKKDEVKVTHSSRVRFKEGEVPNFLGMDKKSAKSLAKKVGLKVDIKGNGVVARQSLLSGSKIQGDTEIELTFKIPKYE